MPIKAKQKGVREQKKKEITKKHGHELLPNGEGEYSTWKGQKSRPTKTQTKHNEGSAQ